MYVDPTQDTGLKTLGRMVLQYAGLLNPILI